MCPQLVFEAVNGYGFLGDMGLDDIVLQLCTGKEITTQIVGCFDPNGVEQRSVNVCLNFIIEFNVMRYIV